MHGGGIIEVPEVPGDDYDDANEVSDVSEDYDDVKGVCDPEDPISGQNDWEDTGTEEDSDRKTESETGWSQHSLRSDKDSGAEREESPMPPGDTDYVVLKDDDSGTQL
ncbi:hypothetical protein Y1Q_0015237 [Alligator mississippiensis]|uniref:Uncharacterized protein n=1 Tax=Alligator mississippiensis TaxID=8496 RepID=A0A151NL21_ALLMI|nr:hypothetical protein Y1Q_0015237 [Alligator mississippiensis]